MKQFLKDLLERSIATFAEAMLGCIGATAMIGDVDWVVALSTAGLATLVTVLKCIVAKCNGDKNSASLVK